MSIKKIFILLFLNCFCLSFSQLIKKPSDIVVYIDLKDKLLKEYSIDKDTMNASFSIYYKKYESKIERDKATEIYNDRVKNRRTSGENPSEVRLPDFSFVLYTFNAKPKRLKSLKGVKFITIKEFQDSGFKATNPTRVIHKLKNGTYLEWSTLALETM